MRRQGKTITLHIPNQQFLALVILIMLSAIIFVLSSEAAFKLERQNRFGYARFDYANPLYLFNVLTAIGSGAIGGTGLIALHKIANAELKKDSSENLDKGE